MNTNRTDTQPNLPDTNPPADWAGRILAAVLLLWIGGVTLAIHFGGTLAAQFMLATGDELPGWGWLPLAAVQSALIVLPTALLGWFWQRPRYRALFQLWAVAGLFPLVMAPVHLPGPLQAPLAAVLQIGLALGFSGLLWVVGRRRGGGGRETTGERESGGRETTLERESGGRETTLERMEAEERREWGLLPVALAVPLLALPWLWSGAFGSWLDIGLNLGAGLALGLAAALALDIFWLRPFYATAGEEEGLPGLLLGGLVAGSALLVMGSGYGYEGQQVPLLFSFSALGWAVMALSRPGGKRRRLALFLGAAAALPLLLLDPREMAAFLMMGDEMAWVVGAVALAVLLGWLAGALLLLWRRLAGGGRAERPRWALLLLLPVWLAAVAVYLGPGHPGLYGEQLFVVLEEQATLAEVPAGEAAARRQVVYETLVTHADSTQAELRRSLERLGIDYVPYYLVNGLAVEGGPLLRLWLASRPEVDRVLANPTLRPIDLAEGATGFGGAAAPTDPPWNLTRIGADRVWAELGVRGAGIVVGQSDSGVQWDHPELADGYRGSAGDHDYNWFDPWYGSEAPVDSGGHGTHTLGTVLGNAVGVAPDATWYGCANLARSLGNTALYLDCMQFMLAPFPLGGDPLRDGDPARGANVLNNSWGCPEIEGCDPEALYPAVRALRAAGTFVVVSAGNDGPDCASLDNPPAIYDEAFSVGASTPGDGLATFSSRGPVLADGSGRVKPDIVAPGTQILSAFPGGSYRSWEGTSMAGPHLAGVVALMWSANPALIGEVEATERILRETAAPFAVNGVCGDAATVPTNTYGFGLVDAFAAVEGALAEGGEPAP